ncbi:serine protease inhibitor 88Ea-like [Nylanderia fulva]|uniref:serine protease inhibitor 88Ea-like n=1 Tax=Nylanderia fulva TaxID=613905 RepID=UPI0010FB972F|nr:serine protease inhibitor 88Ea-like [Nylanderia fulva]
MAYRYKQNILDRDDLIEKKLNEALSKFTFKCLETIMRLKNNKNIVFSPYSIYKGLLLIYLASSNEIQAHIRQKLELPDINIEKGIRIWIMKKRTQNQNLSNYNDENRCWITNTKCLNTKTQLLFRDDLEIVGFHRPHTYLTHLINESLQNTIGNYTRLFVKLKNISKHMEILLATTLGLKGATIKKNNSHHFNKHKNMKNMHSSKNPRTVVSPKLAMIVTELPFIDKNLSLFVLFPAVKFSATWIVRGELLELFERLATREGIDELRRVLDDEESSTVKLQKVIYPNFFELQNELGINKLLNTFDTVRLPYFTAQNLHLGGAKHCAYIKVIPLNSVKVTAGAINMFFTKDGGSFKPVQNINHSRNSNKFICLLYCKDSHTILFIGIVNRDKP